MYVLANPKLSKAKKSQIEALCARAERSLKVFRVSVANFTDIEQAIEDEKAAREKIQSAEPPSTLAELRGAPLMDASNIQRMLAVLHNCRAEVEDKKALLNAASEEIGSALAPILCKAYEAQLTADFGEGHQVLEGARRGNGIKNSTLWNEIERILYFRVQPGLDIQYYLNYGNFLIERTRCVLAGTFTVSVYQYHGRPQCVPCDRPTPPEFIAASQEPESDSESDEDAPGEDSEAA